MQTDTSYVLAFDTSGSYCAAALMRGNRILATRCDPMNRGQAESLFPLLVDLLASANLTWADLSRIGVGIGPGNFTGIRISVAAARGLALSLGIPAVGVSTLEVQHTGAPVLARVFAPRDQCYTQAFGCGPDAPQLVTLDAAKARAENLGVPLGQMLSPPDLVCDIARRAQIAAHAPAPAPLYVRAADAAPPRDPAPVILP